MRSLTILFLVAATQLAACAALTGPGSRVVLLGAADADVVEACERMGHFEVTDADYSSYAERGVRNRAGSEGATHVLITARRDSFPYALKGDAYHCPPQTARGPGGSCARDTDCKGARICDAGACRDP